MMRMICGGCLVLTLLGNGVLAQDGLRPDRRTTERRDNTRISLIFNEASPSDWLATDGMTNPRLDRRTNAGSALASDSNSIDYRLPISANRRFDGEDVAQQYQRQYEGRMWSQQRARHEREMRQLRLEAQKQYGISLSRPDGSALMMGGTYAPSRFSAYGLRNWNASPYFHYQLR